MSHRATLQHTDTHTHVEESSSKGIVSETVLEIKTVKTSLKLTLNETSSRSVGRVNITQITQVPKPYF